MWTGGRLGLTYIHTHTPLCIKPQRRAWQPTLVLLPGESHGQRSLAGYSPWGHKESDMTEQLTHVYKTNN